MAESFGTRMIIRANVATPDIVLGNDDIFEDNLKEVFDETRDQNSIYYIETEYIAFRYHFHVECYFVGIFHILLFFRLLECMNRALQKPFEKEFCPFIFDSWSCFNATLPGQTQIEQCPDFKNLGFNKARNAEKMCLETGEWWVHPETNKSWTNYTSCLDLADVDFRQTINKITMTGLGLSTLFLTLSLAVLTSFPSLKCGRNKIHINLFLSMSLNNITWLLWYVLVLFNSSVWSQNPVWCRVLHVVTTFFMLSTYSWMMCEGAFLWLLTSNTVLEETLWVRRLTLLGWLSPLLTLVPYTVYRHFYENELCWMDHDRSMLFLALPVISVILINIYFLWSVLTVLRQKLQFQNNFNRNNDVTLKSAKAVCILVPIFGLHFLLMPMRPESGSQLEYAYEVRLKAKCLNRIFEYFSRIR